MGGSVTKVAPNPADGVEVRAHAGDAPVARPDEDLQGGRRHSDQTISSDELKSALQKQGCDDVVFATLMGELECSTSTRMAALQSTSPRSAVKGRNGQNL